MSGKSADSVVEPSSRSNIVTWVLLDLERRVLAFGFLLMVFGGIIAASLAFDGAAVALQADDPIETVFQGLIGATVTGVTLVLSLNQLVLSQELGAVNDQQSRMQGAMTFREDVAGILGETPPAEPSAFLRKMISEMGERARRLGEAAADDDEVQQLAGATVENASAVADQLKNAEFGQFEVVRLALDLNHSWKLYATNRLLDRDDLDEETREALEALREALALFGPAREHFKTLYFQSALVNLSRAVLYTALPSLGVAISVVLYVDIENYAGTLLGMDHGVLIAAAATAIVLTPFALLLSYVLRIATITGRTLSIGPFILRETDRNVRG